MSEMSNEVLFTSIAKLINLGVEYLILYSS